MNAWGHLFSFEFIGSMSVAIVLSYMYEMIDPIGAPLVGGMIGILGGLVGFYLSCESHGWWID